MQSNEPTYMERASGGWLAVSPDTDTLRIGVFGYSRDEAANNYSRARAAWKRLVEAAEKRAAASKENP
jgi:hypothetical protein